MIFLIVVIAGCVCGAFIIWPLAQARWRQKHQKLLDRAATRFPDLPWYEAAWKLEYLARSLHIEASEARKVANYWVKRGWVTRRRQKTHREREVFYFTTPAGGRRFGKVILGDAAYYDRNLW